MRERTALEMTVGVSDIGAEHHLVEESLDTLGRTERGKLGLYGFKRSTQEGIPRASACAVEDKNAERLLSVVCAFRQSDAWAGEPTEAALKTLDGVSTIEEPKCVLPCGILDLLAPSGPLGKFKTPGDDLWDGFRLREDHACLLFEEIPRQVQGEGCIPNLMLSRQACHDKKVVRTRGVHGYQTPHLILWTPVPTVAPR